MKQFPMASADWARLYRLSLYLLCELHPSRSLALSELHFPMRALSLISLTQTMRFEQSVDNSHDNCHEPGRDDEERSNEEDKEISPFEQLEDPSVLEPGPQVARSPLAPRHSARPHYPRYR